MGDDHAILERLLTFLQTSPAVAAKVSIEEAYRPAQSLAGTVQIGDDCAAVPQEDGFLLLAAEGMLQSFVADDPWFAGYSAVMVNLSDIAAMGGRPLAIVDILWTPRLSDSAEVWNGMAAASRAYDVPIVGGHTTVTGSGATLLAAAILGKAHKLITSFDARPDDCLLTAVDLRGRYRGDKPFWNASVGAPAERLRRSLRILPLIAERGWCRAGKDISNGGIIGTLSMLLACSKVGAELWLDQIPRPENVPLERWLISFPSFGYLLCVAAEDVSKTIALFNELGVACGQIGQITESPSLVLSYGSARATFHSKV
jgi:AIR synthase-related protein